MQQDISVQVQNGYASIEDAASQSEVRKEAAKITSLISGQFGLIRDIKESSDNGRIKDSVKRNF